MTIKTRGKKWFCRAWISAAAGFAAALLTGPAATAQSLGNILLEDFSTAPLGDVELNEYVGPWSSVGFHARYRNSADELGLTLEVVEDTDNYFGRGTSNQILRSSGAVGWTFRYNLEPGTEVATFSFDMRQHANFVTDTADFEGVTNRLTNRLSTEVDAATPTVVNFSFQADTENDEFTGEYFVRNEAPNLVADPEAVLHFDVISNNSADSIDYSGPDGTGYSLGSGQTAVWIDGDIFVEAYSFGRGADPGDIRSLTFETFSNNPWPADFDNVALTDGVFVIPEPSTVALLMGVAALGGVLFLRRRRDRS